ncbi:MAG: HAMP domain-containing histidine kinase, partial [Oscillibacter sp.]|nr:HAMP domain-containing histidine kinase [Oscillibacter sp.]
YMGFDNLSYRYFYEDAITYVGLLALVAEIFLLYMMVSTWQGLRTAKDIGLLADQITAIHNGDLTTSLALPKDADLSRAAEELGDIQSGLEKALQERTESERMKVELISNVSHDLKTPLTSVLSYAALLEEEDLPGAAGDYARIILEKARRLDTMVQDVFSISKAASGQLKITPERLDLGKLLRQTLADMEDAIEKSGLTFKVDLSVESVEIVSDGARLYRVFQNLIQNALQYSLPGSRVYLTLTAEGERAVSTLRNTSAQELPAGVDFTARFVRGDESRTDGGTGLGLSIAKSFTESCGGTFKVETVADLFTAKVTFPLAQD